ncbi:hypothetical protein PGTUg99_028905 [Puccinia graminis f. sp. tritici]|uniref:Uncharacterized protein n=1 Tax=Puccinia graminis f. sp. tritici TaxID=56615 RepID=A0A5B0RPV3_PUCGR|nr:hypothetical protein PGTUg99_028905 [Puccinia graminis f. sp. tritici]
MFCEFLIFSLTILPATVLAPAPFKAAEIGGTTTSQRGIPLVRENRQLLQSSDQDFSVSGSFQALGTVIRAKGGDNKSSVPRFIEGWIPNNDLAYKKFLDQNLYFKENEDKLNAFDEDCKKLQILLEEISDQHKWATGFQGARSEDFRNDLESSNIIHEKMVTFQKLKLLDLKILDPKLQKYSEDSMRGKQLHHYEIVSSEILLPGGIEAFVNSFVHEVKQILSGCRYEYHYSNISYNKSKILEDRKIFQYLWGAIDLLLKNNFINEEHVKQIFQGDKSLWMASRDHIIYLTHKLGKDIQEGMSNITGHWMWKMGHEFFNVFSEETWLMVNLELSFYNLKWKIRNEAEYKYFAENEEFIAFFNSFSIEKYHDWFEYGHRKPKHPLDLDENKDIFENTIEIPEEFKIDVRNLRSMLIFTLRQDSEDMYRLTRDICEILAIVENSIFPGIIKISFSTEQTKNPILGLLYQKFSWGLKKEEKEINDFQALLQSLLEQSRSSYFYYIRNSVSNLTEKNDELSKWFLKYGNEESKLTSYTAVYPKDNEEFLKYHLAFMEYARNKIPYLNS